MIESAVSIRIGKVADAQPVAALAIQVFLDTYATEGVRPDLANEAFAEYGCEVFEQRLAEPNRRFYLAEQVNGGLVGFAEVLISAKASPVDGVVGSELVRLYVQPQAQACGVGRLLIEQAEAAAGKAAAGGLWLAAWEKNFRALAFYRHLGYDDAGSAQIVIQGQSFGNRIFYKRLDAPKAAPDPRC